MANKVITMQRIRAIIQLLEKGYLLRSISTQVRLLRQPITFYAAKLKKTVYSFDELRRLCDSKLASIAYAHEASLTLPENVGKQELDTKKNAISIMIKLICL